MSFCNELRRNVAGMFAQVQQPLARELANTALAKAEKAESPQKVVEIFRELGTTLIAVEGEDHTISFLLQTFLSDEEKRIERAASEALRPEYQTPPENVERIVVKEVAPQVQKTVEEPTSHSILDSSSPALAMIFQQLSTKDKGSLFQAVAVQQTNRMRAEVLPQIISTLLPLALDLEARIHYAMVFRNSLPSPEIFRERGEAEKKGDKETVRQLDAEIVAAYRRLINLNLETKWSALPEWVKALFGNIDNSGTLQSPESFKSALIAIRAHNLVRLLEDPKLEKVGIVRNRFDLSTKQKLINAGGAVAEWLHEKGATIDCLSLWQAKLTSLPLEVTKCTNLTCLFLWDNHLSTLPPQIGNLTSLTKLCMNKNRLTFLPAEIGNLRQLVELELSENTLTALPSEIGQCSEMQRLDIQHNSLNSLPVEIWNLCNLTSLYIDNNNFTSLPSDIGKLRKLELLTMAYNNLTSLPQEIWTLCKVWHLNLSHNHITALSSEIGKCEQLYRLYISFNDLTSLPDEIGTLSRLTEFWAGSNPLTSQPAWFNELRKRQVMGDYDR